MKETLTYLFAALALIAAASCAKETQPQDNTNQPTGKVFTAVFEANDTNTQQV